jgi:DNA polymerase-4
MGRRHPPTVIAHADMDAFYAAVEQLDNPELRGLPVLVGPPSGRGVVLTASYEARPFKVGSAMPMTQAVKRCPSAVIVPPRFDRYAEVSAIIMETFRNFSPAVEPISMDEAFIDLTGTQHLFGAPTDAAVAIKTAIFEATGGLHATVGIADSKFVAKVASSHAKPNGSCVVPGPQARAWLAPMPVSRLWGAGPKTQARLLRHGYATIGDVARADLAHLESCCGSVGKRFYDLARASDPRPVVGQRGPRSMSSDRTLQADVSSRAQLLQHLKRAADQLGARLRKRKFCARGVRIKLKTNHFETLSRQCQLNQPTDVGSSLFAAAAELLKRVEHPGPFRLVGMAAHTLFPVDSPQQLPLLLQGLTQEDSTRNAKLERTLDDLNDRFGKGTIHRARDLSRTTVLESAPNLDCVSGR